MEKKVGRNDPCPCGSRKKFKQCCQKLPGTRKKIKAKLISGGQKNEQSPMPDLLERTFGDMIAKNNTPPKLPEEPQTKEDPTQNKDKKED